MKKLFIILMLAAISAAGISQDKTGAIHTGYTMLSRPLAFTAADTINASDSLVVLISNPQKYLQYQTISTVLEEISGAHAVTITARGRVTATDTWHPIGSAVSWTGESDNPGVITATAPLNYNWIKITYVASGATQTVAVSSLDIKTANAYTSQNMYLQAGYDLIGSSTSDITMNTNKFTVAGATGNTVIAGTLGVTGAATFTGLITANNGVTLGAGDDLIGSSTSDITINTNKFTVAGATGNTVVAGTLGVTGATTATGAVALNGGFTTPNLSPVIWARGGNVITATTGTDVACANGTRFWVELDIPYNVTLTGIAYLVGSVGGTDSVVVQLCNSAGVQVATSRNVGTAANIVGTTAQFQSVAFDATYAAIAGKYYAVVQFNGTNAKFRAYAIPGMKFITGTAAGTWGTKADITPGTSYTADKGPILMTY